MQTNRPAHSTERGPLDRIARLETPTIHSAGRRVHAHSTFDVSFRLPDVRQRVKFVLEPNHDILPPGAAVKFVNAAGEVETETIDRKQHRIFKGTAWLEEQKDDWMRVGWARVSVHRDGEQPVFEGVFTIGNDHHHIQLGTFYKSTKHASDPYLKFDEHNDMIVWRDSDLSRSDLRTELKRDVALEPACNAHKLAFNSDPQHPIFSAGTRSTGSWGSMSFGSLLGKRQIDGGGAPGGGNSAGVNLKSTIGSTIGCPTTRKVALMGVATDCTYLQSFQGNNQTMRSNVINQINSASHVYETSFNVSLGLQTLFTQAADCPSTAPASAPWNLPCTSNATISSRLNEFSSWRGQQKDTNAYWTLLTNCPTQSEVGLAWLGQLCVATAQNSSGQTATGANVVAKTNTEWTVIAHETGHTFGAVHDCDSQTCSDGTTVNAQQCCPRSNSTCDAGGQFIMNPSTGDGVTSFSPCTIGNICSAMGRNSVKTDCLSDNTGVTTITGHECGNGIVEEGEDCDCGGTEGCGNNKCCDPNTCKFTTGSVCDDANEECCRGCQLATKGTVCRPSTGSCNPEEVCSGTNSTCPADTTTPDGQGCGNNLECASGQCTSRDLQCKQLMGSYTSNNDTYACDNSDCMLSCASPEFGQNTCYSMQQNFLDGTPCGATGRCSNVSFLFPLSSLLYLPFPFPHPCTIHSNNPRAHAKATA
jgi:Metallo-peptidase family M12/Disintegrin